MTLSKQEALFFDRVAHTLADHPTFSIEQAARYVLDRDIDILNRYCRLPDEEQRRVKQDFLSGVYHALRAKAKGA